MSLLHAWWTHSFLLNDLKKYHRFRTFEASPSKLNSVWNLGRVIITEVLSIEVKCHSPDCWMQTYFTSSRCSHSSHLFPSMLFANGDFAFFK